MSNQSLEKMLDVVSVACDLLLKLHQFVFSSSVINFDPKAKLKATLQVSGEKTGIFQDCEILYDNHLPINLIKGNVIPRDPKYFYGWEPARLCYIELRFQRVVFDRAYFFFALPFLNHLFNHWIEKNDIWLLTEPKEVFYQNMLSCHLPLIADVVVHEMRHEAQIRGGVTLRDGNFLKREYPEIYAIAVSEWNENLARTQRAYQGQPQKMLKEIDACVAGAAARWIWQNISSPDSRLLKVKNLILG